MKKAQSKDKEIAAAPRRPAERPQDRYSCSDKRLFRYVDEQATVSARLLEGEVFQGTVRWCGRFEFGLGLKGDGEVVIFRHALHDLATA